MKKILTITAIALAFTACSESSTSVKDDVVYEDDLFYCKDDGHYYATQEDYDSYCGKFNWGGIEDSVVQEQGEDEMCITFGDELICEGDEGVVFEEVDEE